MGSPCEILCESVDEKIARKLIGLGAAEAWRIEKKFSRYLDDNIVARINSSQGNEVIVDEETARLIEFCAELYKISDGKFDITSGVLRRVWSFDGSDKVPSSRSIAAVLPYVGWHQVSWTGEALCMPPGMEIDLGGVGKEYAVDRAVALIREQGSASCLVNFGGDLATTCSPVNRPAWQVGVDSAQAEGQIPERLIRLSSGALATSGDTRRFLQKDGKRYGHVINPKTGWPIDGAPASITVAAGSCVEAGMICTMAMLAGHEAEAYLREQNLQHWVVR